MKKGQGNRKDDLSAPSKRVFPAIEAGGRFAGYLSVALLIVLSVTYLSFFGESIFFLQENNSLFIFSTDYFQKFCSEPGGLLVYAGNFLTQFYFSSFYGSLIVSALIMLAYLVFRRINKQLKAESSLSSFLVLLPSCLLLLLQTRYDFYPYYILGFILTGLWFLITTAPGKGTRRYILTGLFPLFYYLAGSFALIYIILYLVYCLIYGKGRLRYLLPTFLILLSFLTFLLFKDLVFLQPVSHLLFYPLFLYEYSSLTEYLSLFSGVLILYPLLIKSADVATSKIKFQPLFSLSAKLVLFSLTLFLLFRNRDPGAADILRIERSVYNREWDEVIRQYEKSPSSNIIGQYYYNLALSEKGELCSRMFYGRQSFGSLSLALARDDEQTYRAIYFYYAVGLTGEAHHLAYELMVQHGFRPENIKMLIKTELIIGNYRIAERYINVLKKTMHYRKWAVKYEKMLYKPDLVNSDPELGGKIRLLPAKDFFVVTDDSRNVDLLSEENPGNRRAFEYRMARLLLDKDLVEIGKEVRKFKALGYSNFPRHVEEAIVSLVNVTGEFPDLGGLMISKDTDQRFLRYFSDLKSLRGSKAQIENGIKKADKNTFWYYLQFGTMKSAVGKGGQADNSIY
jgi:Family of unknown function (DUF6057)